MIWASVWAWLRRVPAWLWLALATVLSLGYAWRTRRALIDERRARLEEREAIGRVVAEAGDRHAAELVAERARGAAAAEEAARRAAADARHEAEQARIDADGAFLEEAVAGDDLAGEVNRRLDEGLLGAGR